jgi:hypothetical protein
MKLLEKIDSKILKYERKIKNQKTTTTYSRGLLAGYTEMIEVLKELKKEIGNER